MVRIDLRGGPLPSVTRVVSGSLYIDLRGGPLQSITRVRGLGSGGVARPIEIFGFGGLMRDEAEGRAPGVLGEARRVCLGEEKRGRAP